MKIKITYVGTLNGIGGIWCGFKPEGVIVSEERQVLYPEEGSLLKRDNETFECVWLKDNDTQENYTEVPRPEEPEELTPKDLNG